MEKINDTNKTIDPWRLNVEEFLKEGLNDEFLGPDLSAIMAEMNWLYQVLKYRKRVFLRQGAKPSNSEKIVAPDLSQYTSAYTEFVKEKNLSEEERLVITLALAPHVCPEMLDTLVLKNGKTGAVFTQFGGVRGEAHPSMLPTVATAAFLLRGNSPRGRFAAYKLFKEQSPLIRHQVVTLWQEHPKDPASASIIEIGAEYLVKFTTGEAYEPKFSAEFPAQKLTTRLEWEDLVLEYESRYRVEEILSWMKNSKTILEDWEMDTVFKKGYRALFYGPPGTGKTLTACLIGKKTGRLVYRIDISKVVSKYIGETEKNLARIFDIAESKGWILFFDEADSLFGKRTQTSDSKDRYANQEVAFLLQRIEDYDGTVLLSTNLKSNLDPAFMRRFQSIVNFPIPSIEQRMRLWKQSIRKAPVDESINFYEIAKKYGTSGGMIINVLRSCCVAAVERDNPMIYEDDIIEGIKAEFRKSGKSVR